LNKSSTHCDDAGKRKFLSLSINYKPIPEPDAKIALKPFENGLSTAKVCFNLNEVRMTKYKFKLLNDG